MRTFTREELKKYDGSSGIIYTAYHGKVYDVSSSYHWRKGTHQVMHRAGSDLTEALEQAPHDAGLLEKFPVVGELVR
ncbi:MAG: cytochrome b5 domain-containing protein [Dehalococcoidales bacterium]|nr:cytochrome b5 domain-containing protein [Dehalococcoidales bacterium]